MSFWVWPILLGLIATIFLLVKGKWVTRREEKGYNDDIRQAEKSVNLRPIAGISAALTVVMFIAGGVVTMATGQVGVVGFMGILDLDDVVEEGSIGWVWPWEKVERVNIQLINLDFSHEGGDPIASITQDEVALSIDVTIPVRVNPAAVPTILAKIKGDWADFVGPYVRSGARDGAAQSKWQAAVSGDRTALALSINTAVADKLAKTLIENGFPAGLAESTFLISPVQLRAIRPPDRVQVAMNERAAASLKEETMSLLVDAARKEAEVREQEGSGYSKLLSGLPEGVTASDAAMLITAISGFKQVEALSVLIEKSSQGSGTAPNFNVIIGGNGNATPVIPTGQMAAKPEVK